MGLNLTALKKYDRLDATGLWRAHAEDQRQEVIVSIGNATLIIKDNNERAISHWSLAAIETLDTTQENVIFSPDLDTDETLLLSRSEGDMIEAIETIQKAVKKSRPHSGRLRWIGALLSLALLAFLAIFWLPEALQKHSLRVVPAATRLHIGEILFKRLEYYTGRACMTLEGQNALRNLSKRTQSTQLAILPSGSFDSLHLPGDVIVLNKNLVEDYDEPDVVAGFILAEQTRAQTTDSLGRLLQHLDIFATISLLTTGEISTSALDEYAKILLKTPSAAAPSEALLGQFARRNIRSTPYAWAVDPTGESTFELIEADPVTPDTAVPVLSDNDWLRLQGICGN